MALGLASAVRVFLFYDILSLTKKFCQCQVTNVRQSTYLQGISTLAYTFLVSNIKSANKNDKMVD